MNYRVGFGYDSHRLATGRNLWLGGVKVEYEKGLLGHSDADVLLHSIIDALLGAAAMRDIGYHFPDESDDTLDMDSKEMLSKVAALLAEKSFAIGNIDATICAEQPKIAPYIDDMRHTVAQVLGISIHQVSIKATTNEGMGFVGQGEGIASFAVVLITSPQ